MNNIETPLPWDALKWCPRCGSKKFDAKEKNALFCNDCGYHHFFNPAGAVIAIVMNELGEILVTERAIEPFKGLLDFPGGFIMPDESAEEAVRRELKEELNAEVTGMRFLQSQPNRYPYSGVIVFTMDLVFEVEVKDLATLKAGDDVMTFQFYSKEKLDRSNFGGNSASKVVDQILKGYL